MRSKKGILICVVIVLSLLLVGLVVLLCTLESRDDVSQTQPVANYIEETVPETTAETVPETTAQTVPETTLPKIDAPEHLIRLMELNPETEEFVLSYSQKKDLVFEYTLDEYKDCEEVPLLLQWDERWGYGYYAGELMGISGCGPTCLSMVCIYLLGDTGLTPEALARFSSENAFCEDGIGSAWTLISRGGPMLGLDVTEIPLHKERIFRNLEVGNPIICVMGPGDFTTTGHFIVLTGVEDGKLKINDPNSRTRSEMLWEYEDIESQFRNLWVCRA